MEGASDPIAISIGDGAISHVANRIFFYKDVDQKSIHELVEKLHEVSSDCVATSMEWSIPIPPIHLHINSNGGDVYAALAALDHVRACKAPVYTHVDGAAASAATLLSIAGAKRFMYPNGYMLIHQISSEFWGKYEEIKDEISNLNVLMEHVCRLYEGFTSIPRKTLDGLLKRDLWLPAEQCLAWGLVDEIEGPRMPASKALEERAKKKRAKKKRK